MKLEKGMISISQFTLLVASYVTGSVVTVTFATRLTSHDNWLAVLGGFVISLPIVLLYGTLAHTFPTQNLVQIHDLVYGPYIGKLISIAYLFYIFLVFISNLRFMGDFTLTYLFPETPLSVTILLFVIIVAWAVHSGIEVIARMAFPLLTVTSIFLAIAIILLIKDMEPTYFLPIFEIPIDKFVHAVHVMLTIPFAEVVLFLLIFPNVKDNKRIIRSYLLGFSIGAVYIFIVVVRNIATLGPYIDIFTGPSYEAVRQINVGQFLTRLEVLFAIALIMMVFIRCSLLLYTTALGTAQLFKLRSYLPLVIPLGILGISFSILSFDSVMDMANEAINVWPFYNLPFEVFLPLLSLMIAKMRHLPKGIQGARS